MSSSGTINKTTILGHLGRDPETHTFADGNKVTSLSVATSERWTDKNDQKQERTEWHRVSLYGSFADTAAEYLKKGSKVYIEGKLQTRTFTDNAGAERSVTEVIVSFPGGDLALIDRNEPEASRPTQQPQQRQTRQSGPSGRR